MCFFDFLPAIRGENDETFDKINVSGFTWVIQPPTSSYIKYTSIYIFDVLVPRQATSFQWVINVFDVFFFNVSDNLESRHLDSVFLFLKPGNLGFAKRFCCWISPWD